MSTILNTLKKLEEEKSVLDRSLNLKGLVLQSDRAVYPRDDKAPGGQARGLIGLIIGGIVVGVSLGVYFNPTDKATAKSAPLENRVQVPARENPVEAALPVPGPVQPASVQPAPTPAQPAPVVDPIAKATPKEVARGIPLSSIQSPSTAKPVAIEPVKTSPAPTQHPVQVAKVNPAPPAPSAKTAVSSSPAKPLAQASNIPTESPFEDPVDDNRPESEIIAMEVLPDSYESDSGIAGATVKRLPSAQASQDKAKEPAGYSGIPIPGVKMKGIIFFGANNASNYILLTGPKVPNQKLKTGETFQEATLKEVHPDRAVFSYKDQMTQLRIGE